MTLQDRKEEHYRKLVRRQKIGMIFIRAVGKRRRNIRDRLLVALARRLMPEGDPAEDFMRDAICDSEPEFSVEELRTFQSQTHSGEKG